MIPAIKKNFWVYFDFVLAKLLFYWMIVSTWQQTRATYSYKTTNHFHKDFCCGKTNWFESPKWHSSIQNEAIYTHHTTHPPPKKKAQQITINVLWGVGFSFKSYQYFEWSFVAKNKKQVEEVYLREKPSQIHVNFISNGKKYTWFLSRSSPMSCS